MYYEKFAKEELIELLLNRDSIIDELKKQVSEIAVTDELTNTYNRRAIINQLDREIRRAERNKTTLSLLILDIDDFKYVNDEHGHNIGDKVLMQIAAAVKKNIRSIDYLGRYGGEEFLVILPDTPVEKAQIVAERIRDCIAKGKFAGHLKINVSGGLAQYPQCGFEVSKTASFINEADKMLHLAKASGKNRVIYGKL
jgi:diguanylate cyclase (GGDEF)-like protein